MMIYLSWPCVCGRILACAVRGRSSKAGCGFGTRAARRRRLHNGTSRRRRRPLPVFFCFFVLHIVVCWAPLGGGSSCAAERH